MSIDQQIETLEKLSETDKLVRTLTESVAKERGELDTIKIEVAQIDERLEIDRNSVAEMEKTRADLMLELRQFSQQIDRSRERLQRSRNEREVNAAERELDELRKIQRDRDDEVKKLVTLSDHARESIQKAEERRAALSERLAVTIDGANKTIANMEQQLAAARALREKLAATLPRLLRRRYDSMNKRGKVPIAKTHDGTCLGCYVKIMPMVFHRMLSRQKFEECPSCYRIIYYTPKPSEEELAAEAAAAEANAAEANAAEAAEGVTSEGSSSDKSAAGAKATSTEASG